MRPHAAGAELHAAGREAEISGEDLMSFFQQPGGEGLLQAVATDIQTHSIISSVYVCVYYEKSWRLRCSKICVYKRSDREDGHKIPCVQGPIRVHGS